MFKPETLEDIEQGIETLRARREGLDRVIRQLQLALNNIQSISAGEDLIALSPTLYGARDIGTEWDSLPAAPHTEPPAYLPRYNGGSYHFRLVQAILDMMLEERPLKRKTIIDRLRAQGLDEKPTQDFGNLVSRTLTHEPRFVRCARIGFWTLEGWAVPMGPLTSPGDTLDA